MVVTQTFPKVFLNLLRMMDDVEEKGKAFIKQAPGKSKILKSESILWII